MSYENLSHDSRSILESSGFTQISNKVINNIKSGDAFLVWCYLYSKSENWKTIKQNVKNVYGYGDDKLKQIFSYLNRSNLIEYVQRTGSKGHFEPVQIKVLNGSKFDINQQFNMDKTAGVKNRQAVDHTCGFDELLNKDITKQRKERKTKSFCSSDDELPLFDKFWSDYPRKQKKKEAKAVWQKLGLEKNGQTIIQHVINRKETEWRDKEIHFIPLPDTFLRGDRYEDEILISHDMLKKETNNNFSSALKQFGLR